MAEKRYCHFVSEGNRVCFLIEDGGTIFIDGTEYEVNYISNDHFMVDYKCYNGNEFYERIVLGGRHLVLPGKLLKTEKYGRNYKPYIPGTYQIISLQGWEEIFEFSNLRIIRETLPLGRYAYDIVSESNGKGYYDYWLCKRPAMFNHLGTIISCINLFDDYDDNRIYLKDGITFRDDLRKELTII